MWMMALKLYRWKDNSFSPLSATVWWGEGVQLFSFLHYFIITELMPVYSDMSEQYALHITLCLQINNLKWRRQNL